MTDETEWSETDSKWTKRESEELSLTSALDEDCQECGAMLSWVLDPDPDSLRYTAECGQCDSRYSIKPTKAVIVQMEDEP